MPSIEQLSYEIRGELDIYTISDRKTFPILVINKYNIKKIGIFKETVLGENVQFQYKSLKIVVHERFYEKFKIAIEGYFSYSDKYDFRVLLKLKLPSTNILSLIKIKKNILYKKITILNSEQKSEIDAIIDDVLQHKELTNSKYINTITKIIHFIDLAFIKMIAPEYKEEILAYT